MSVARAPPPYQPWNCLQNSPSFARSHRRRRLSLHGYRLLPGMRRRGRPRHINAPPPSQSQLSTRHTAGRPGGTWQPSQCGRAKQVWAWSRRRRCRSCIC